MHFLPGPHVIEVGYAGELLRSVSPMTVHFVGQGGKSYSLKYEILRGERRWRAWIEEDPGT